MHQVRPVAPPAQPVALLSEIGQVWRYASLRALIDALGLQWIGAYVGPNHVQTRVLAGAERLTTTFPYIIRGSFGEVLTFEDCRAVANLDVEPWWVRSRPALLSWNGFGPVPYVHRARGGHFFRRIATHGEHRACAAVLPEEGEPAFRGKRRGHNLPTAYDDRPISAYRNRSWKSFRRTRWKGV